MNQKQDWLSQLQEKNLKINYTLTKTNEHLSITSAGENHAFKFKTNKSRRWKHTLPDLIKICFICDTQFPVKYNLPRKKYSQKNLWGYWTQKPTDQNKYICSSCLKKNLLGRFDDWGVNTQKFRIFHIYLDRNQL
jgi:hypothetical protein